VAVSVVGPCDIDDAIYCAIVVEGAIMVDGAINDTIVDETGDVRLELARS